MKGPERRPGDPSSAESGLEAVRTITPRERAQRERAAVKHGLYARAKSTLRHRNYRAGRLLTRLQELLPLRELDMPVARAWCEHEILASDAYATLQQHGLDNERLIEVYLRVRQRQLNFARELGMTPAAAAQLQTSVHSAVKAGADALEAQDRLRAAAARRVEGSPS